MRFFSNCEDSKFNDGDGYLTSYADEEGDGWGDGENYGNGQGNSPSVIKVYPTDSDFERVNSQIIYYPKPLIQYWN